MSMRRSVSEPSLGRSGSVGAFSRSRRFEPPEPFWVSYSRRHGGYPSVPSSPSAQRKPGSTNRPQPPGVRPFQKSTSFSDVAPRPPPVHELVPNQLKNKVLELVRESPQGPKQRGSVVIEMSWSESGYLPAHAQPSSQDPNNFTWGEKYKRLAGELRQVLADKAISVTDFKTPVLKKSQRIYDRYSEWERRLPKSTPSNASHKSSVPSRLGAFEVHLVQSTWDPERCCPATLGNHRHQGPAVNLPEGIFCAACAEVLRDERPMTYTKEHLKEQHMLLHSKLWTRRWPGLKPLLVRIGIALRRARSATVPPPPLVARPVRLVEVDRPVCKDADLAPRCLTFERKPLKCPEDPAEIIRKKMSALDCPAQKGWILDLSMGAEVLCKCGGGSHQLSIGAVIAEIQPLGFDADSFRRFVEQKREQFEGEDVNTFLRSFLDTEGQEVMARLVSARRQKVQDQRDLEESAFQRLLASKEDLMSQQRDICEAYSTALREGQVQAERVFVKYCLTCATSVPGAQVNIDPDSTSVEDALEELDRAKQLNETLEKAWVDWEEVIECWLDVPEVFQQRPDLANANFDKDDAEAKGAQLRKQADMIRRKMTKCLPDRNDYSDRLLRIQEEWAHCVEEYRESTEGFLVDDCRMPA